MCLHDDIHWTDIYLCHLPMPKEQEEGVICKAQVTVYHQPFSEVYFLQLIIHSLLYNFGPTTVSCQEIGERGLHWTVSELITLYWIELKAKALYDCGVDRIFCQPKWINNSFEDTVMMLEQILRYRYSLFLIIFHLSWRYSWWLLASPWPQ